MRRSVERAVGMKLFEFSGIQLVACCEHCAKFAAATLELTGEPICLGRQGPAEEEGAVCAGGCE